MIVDNPEVTLEDDGRGIPDEAREAAFLDWLCAFSAHGDDGKQYWFGCSPLSLAFEAMDMWHMEVSWDTGKVLEPAGSVYRIAEFPQNALKGGERLPGGALRVNKSEKQVTVDLGDFHLVCKADNSWHYSMEDKASGVSAKFVHTVEGFPTWYGKEKPSSLTQHSIAYGYNWSGRVEGMLSLDGRTIRIRGKGIRERYVAVDTSAAEIGGWEDWMWFHFDEVFGSMYEMKLGSKDMSLYLVDDNEYCPAGSFNIEHQGWAYLPALGAFIPTRYAITMETEAGVLEMAANAVGATPWGVTGKVPDAPVVTLNFDKVEGTFSYKDGRKRTLTNGMGGTSIRLWKPYPSILLSDIVAAGITNEPGTRLTTL
jgi:hypothetical protein